MVYLVIADPPLELGAVTLTDALEELMGVAEIVVGAPGKIAATPIVTVVVPVEVAPPDIVALAVIVNVVEASAAVGVPEITPVEVLSVSPAGNPGLIEYVVPVGLAPEIEVIIDVIGVPNVALKEDVEVLTPRGVVNVVAADAEPVPTLFFAATTVL